MTPGPRTPLMVDTVCTARGDISAISCSRYRLVLQAPQRDLCCGLGSNGSLVASATPIILRTPLVLHRLRNGREQIAVRQSVFGKFFTACTIARLGTGSGEDCPVMVAGRRGDCLSGYEMDTIVGENFRQISGKFQAFPCSREYSCKAVYRLSRVMNTFNHAARRVLAQPETVEPQRVHARRG